MASKKSRRNRSRQSKKHQLESDFVLVKTRLPHTCPDCHVPTRTKDSCVPCRAQKLHDLVHQSMPLEEFMSAPDSQDKSDPSFRDLRDKDADLWKANFGTVGAEEDNLYDPDTPDCSEEEQAPLRKLILGIDSKEEDESFSDCPCGLASTMRRVARCDCCKFLAYLDFCSYDCKKTFDSAMSCPHPACTLGVLTLC